MLKSQLTSKIRLISKLPTLGTRRKFHQNLIRFNDHKIENEFLIHVNFNIETHLSGRLDHLPENTPLLLKKWLIPKETSPLVAKQKVMILQYGGQLFQYSSMIEGLITPNSSLVRVDDNLEEGIPITITDTLFEVNRNDLYLTSSQRAVYGKVLQFLVKPGDWVERNQPGVVIEKDGKVKEWKFLKSGRIFDYSCKVGDSIGFFLGPFELMEQEKKSNNEPLLIGKYIGISHENPSYRPDRLPQMYYFENHNCGITTDEYEYYTEHHSIEWFVKEGQVVKKGDLLCNYQVPKLCLEFMSPYDGEMVWLRRDPMFLGDPFFEIIIHQ